LGVRNLTRADKNQRMAAAAAEVSERASSAVFMRVSRIGGDPAASMMEARLGLNGMRHR
jgi:hypothetical protein